MSSLDNNSTVVLTANFSVEGKEPWFFFSIFGSCYSIYSSLLPDEPMSPFGVVNKEIQLIATKKSTWERFRKACIVVSLTVTELSTTEELR